MKIAIVHEWLQSYAGSERVVGELLQCFPDADVFAVVDFMPESERGFLNGRPITTSFIQRLPLARKYFRSFLPLMPLAVEQFDLSAYDLVVSSSHAVAKGVITGPHQVHISYVHSPMRYAWDLQAQYLRQSGLERGLKSAYVRWMLHGMRLWDVRTANGVDLFIANSSYIAARIRKVYRREALVIHPPVEVDRFVPGGARGEEYLIAARFVPYKRVDLVAAAFARMPERKLRIVGYGPDREVVRRAAAGAANIRFSTALDNAEFLQALQTARAFVFAAEEDFGITMVEALACGTPVIAFARGGARDIVDDGRTGIMFAEQTVESIMVAVERFEALSPPIESTACTLSTRRFSQTEFRKQIQEAVDQTLQDSGFFDAEVRKATGLYPKKGRIHAFFEACPPPI